MKKHKNIYIYIVLALLAVALVPQLRSPVTSGIVYVSRPIAEPMSNLAHSSNSFISGIFEIGSLRSQNKDLASKIKSLQLDKTELEELRHENQVLKNQLGFLDEHKEASLLAARIIGREPFGALDRIVIDKGAKDGVKEHAAVVSNGALVGRVSEVYDYQAKIILITSKDSIVQAMLQNSRTLGIIKGSLEGVKLENIPQETAIADREAIVTSGLGGEISPGILIGWAKGATSSKSEIYKVLSIEIAEDLTKLEYVFVIK